MEKIFFSILLFIIINCISLLFQKKASIKGENIKIIRNNNFNYGKLPDSIQDITSNFSRFSYISDIVIKVYILIYIGAVINSNQPYEIFYHTLIMISLIIPTNKTNSEYTSNIVKNIREIYVGYIFLILRF